MNLKIMKFFQNAAWTRSRFITNLNCLLAMSESSDAGRSVSQTELQQKQMKANNKKGTSPIFATIASPAIPSTATSNLSAVAPIQIIVPAAAAAESATSSPSETMYTPAAPVSHESSSSPVASFYTPKAISTSPTNNFRLSKESPSFQPGIPWPLPAGTTAPATTPANAAATASSTAAVLELNATAAKLSSGFKFNPATPSFSPALSASIVEEDTVPADEDERDRAKRLAREDKQVRQVEAYLSDENLAHDEYLQFAMAATPEEWVKLNTLCSFNRMKKLKANVKRLAELCQTSPLLCLADNRKAVRRALPLPDSLSKARRTVVLQMLPQNISVEVLRAQLAPLGAIESIRVSRALPVLPTSAAQLKPSHDDVTASVSASPSVGPIASSPQLNGANGKSNASKPFSLISSPPLSASAPAFSPALTSLSEQHEVLPESLSLNDHSSPSLTLLKSAATACTEVTQAHVCFASIEAALLVLDWFDDGVALSSTNTALSSAMSATEHSLQWRRESIYASIQCVSFASLSRERGLKDRRKAASSPSLHSASKPPRSDRSQAGSPPPQPESAEHTRQRSNSGTASAGGRRRSDAGKPSPSLGPARSPNLPPIAPTASSPSLGPSLGRWSMARRMSDTAPSPPLLAQSAQLGGSFSLSAPSAQASASSPGLSATASPSMRPRLSPSMSPGGGGLTQQAKGPTGAGFSAGRGRPLSAGASPSPSH